MEGVHREVSLLPGNIIDSDSTPIADSGVLVNDRPTNDRSSADTDIWNSSFGVFLFLLIRFVVGGPHAVHPIQGSAGFDQGSNTDD